MVIHKCHRCLYNNVMEIINSENYCVIKPFAQKLDWRETQRIFNEVENSGYKSIGFDLSFVEECSFEFINILKNFSTDFRISLFNIPSDIFVLLSFMNMDKTFALFVSENDFQDSLHQLVMRRFNVV